LKLGRIDEIRESQSARIFDEASDVERPICSFLTSDLRYGSMIAYVEELGRSEETVLPKIRERSFRVERPFSWSEEEVKF